jgi:A/G-specific adenine glycosylase
MFSDSQTEQFRRDLLSWFAVSARDLPWRRTTDPYAIWVSEIMLQQTRVAAVVPFYERFIKRFPDYHKLAASADNDLLSHWSGLGYYYRARNMRTAAKMICEVGAFPEDYAEIRELPGVGDYTAAAIASIAFHQPQAAVDGNVVRVISRILNENANPSTVRGKRHFAQLATELLDAQNPGTFNQAMMELGATVCLPKNPQCLACPIAGLCAARAAGSQRDLPNKKVKIKNEEELRQAFWIEHEGRLLAWQRPANSRLMPGFWELPEPVHLPHVELGEKLGSFRHGITIHNYRFDLHTASVPSEVGQCEWLNLSEMSHLPLSTTLNKAKRLRENLKRQARVISASAG